MLDEYIEFGESFSEISEEVLNLPRSRAIFSACQQHKSFEIVDLRVLKVDGKIIAEMIVADSFNDGVPTRNSLGIHYSERIALVFYTQKDKYPEARALRRDFPVTPH
jgi:hypothetical protein